MTFHAHVNTNSDLHSLPSCTPVPILSKRPITLFPRLNAYTNSLVPKQKLLNPGKNDEEYSRPPKTSLYPTSEIPSLSLIPYTLWSTSGRVSTELRGVLHSLSDHRKKRPIYTQLPSNWWEKRVDGQKQNRIKQML